MLQEKERSFPHILIGKEGLGWGGGGRGGGVL